MTVSELRAILAKLPDDAPVLLDGCSGSLLTPADALVQEVTQVTQLHYMTRTSQMMPEVYRAPSVKAAVLFTSDF